MKKILFALTALLSANAVSAQPPLTTPVVVEDYYPFTTFGGELDGGEALGHMNAYSMGYVEVNGTQSDLYTYTWDVGEANPLNAAINIGGFAVRQYAAGVPVNSTSSSLLDDAVILYPAGSNGYCRSVESGILMNNGTAYIMVTYITEVFGTSPSSEYMLDLYEWTTGGLVQMPGYPIPFTSSFTGGMLDNGWIHQDISRGEKAVITYSFDGKVYATAAKMTSVGLDIYGSFDLDLGVFNNPQVQKPDVALQYNVSNQQWDIYYTFTSDDDQTLYVAKGKWDDLIVPGIANGNYMGPVPVDFIDLQTTTGAYDLPRIDANDIAINDDERLWSCVVGEEVGTDDLIFTTYGDHSGSINSTNLNEGILGATKISVFTPGNTNFYNKRPVVAFSQNKQEMYYGWCYRDDAFGFSILPHANYISLKLHINGSVLNDWNPIAINPITGLPGVYEYARVQDNTTISPGNGYYKRAIAFSVENATNPQLFSAFFQTEPGNENNYFIAQKTTDWITANFRPSPKNELENSMTTISVYPNPSNDYFVLTGGVEYEDFSLKIVDILGRQIANDKGTINQLNGNLRQLHLSNGNYLIQLSNSQGLLQDIKVVKH